MTPQELYRDRKVWSHSFGHRPLVMPWQVKPYRRETLSANVNFYTADREAKTLIIGFCGRGNRLFLPVGAILQTLDYKRLDLLTVWDPRNVQYDQGVQGYALSLPQLADRLSTFAEAKQYSRVVTYGISNGGLVGLRMGQLMKADRAISAGGRFSWNIGRMLQGRPYAQSFDLLCHCRQDSTVESYALFSESDADDAEDARRLEAVFPACTIVPIQSDEHNFPQEMHKARRLDEYHRQLFDLDRKPDAEVLKGLVRKRSRFDPRRTFYFDI
ncbi:hypothetical protein ABMA32_11650 [Mesorhizobium sp. VNQ89]|uniref:hypothetical protein n=1 Tax=Mesorhizobium quangtriensis TaxID=3157709 RepID=UPI0032B86E12